MDLTLKQDIRKLTNDTNKVEEGLAVLEQDYVDWAREREQNDLMQIIEYVKRLEKGVSIMMSDYFTLGHRGGNKMVIEDLHLAFTHLNSLFGDVKKIKTELNDLYIHPGELKQLKIDCERFRKTIREIHKHFMESENLLKEANVPQSSRRLKEHSF